MIHPEWANIRRGIVHNEDTGESWQFFMNPEEITTQIEVNWTKSAAIGASYERLSYQNTANATFDLVLRHNRIWFADVSRAPIDQVNLSPQGFASGRQLNPSEYDTIRDEFEKKRRFLMSLCYPRGRVNDVVRRSPPHCILLWPGYLAVRVILRSLQMADSQFDTNGQPVYFEASCQFEEYRTYRLTSADVFKVGFIRQTVGAK